MKIALASAPVIDKDIQQNLRSILQAVEMCRGKADMVVFGESVLQGFNSLTWDYETDRQMAVSQTDDSILQICRAAKRYNIAISFGYIEQAGDFLFSSQIVIDASGSILHNFHRVSVGWKEYWHTDDHYREGVHFEAFSYKGKRFAIGLCGDLWTDGRPEEMGSLHADIVLWPVWCDYRADEWNRSVKHEYAKQAALCGEQVLLVNPFCASPGATDCASGGAAYFKSGAIAKEAPAGSSGILIVEV